MNTEVKPHTRFRVSMRHIDIFGHVHNSVYLDYCEDAVLEYLRAADLFSYFRVRNSDFAYHVKKAEITFHNPIDVDDMVDARARVAHVGTTSLSFEIDLLRARDQVSCASGKLVWVCVDLKEGRPAPIPDATLAALRSVP
ncbi:thioesterase family protein [Ramlibacter sp.]|uniref:acyl-CoA thioesterase n=1 Tax=Ramlibacter sp. TaxID=1917967 RepID=UPI0017B51DEB|nr:thioesterase family protein [Ramlibacter sp.]MBA2673886.1 acyl-CoA thioesterase [Ramlibacter sp.]